MPQTLPTVQDATPTPNVDLTSSAGLEYRAKAQLGQAVRDSANEIGAQIEAQQQINNQRTMATAAIEADRTAFDLAEEFPDPEQFASAVEGIVDQQVSAADGAIAQDLELMLRRRYQREELRLRTAANQEALREAENATTMRMDNSYAQADTLAREYGPSAWDMPEFQAIRTSVAQDAQWRATADGLNYPEEYAQQALDEFDQNARIGFVRHTALAVYEDSGNVEEARGFVEEALGGLTLSSTEYDTYSRSILSDVRQIDQDRRRASAAALEAMQGEIRDVEANAANRGELPPASFVRRMSGLPQGAEIMAGINESVDLYDLRQSYITADYRERASLVQEVQDNYTGVALDNRLQAISQAQGVINSYRDDPAGFVMATNEDVASLWQQAQESGDPALTMRATGELLDAQRRAGWLDRDTRIVSDDQAARMVESFVLDPEDPNMRATLVSTVTGIEQTYGPYASQLFGELEQAGMPPAALLIANTQGTAASALAERAATSTTQERRAMIQSRDANSGSRDRSALSQLSEEVNRVLDPVFSTIVPGNPNVASDFDRAFSQTMDLAMQAHIEGATPRQAAEMAARAYTDRYQFEGTLRIPTNVVVPDVEYRIDRYMDNLMAPPTADESGATIDLSRPRIPMGDGSYATEYSITVTDPRLNDGRPTNIPSIWGGQFLGDDAAVENAVQSGQTFAAFDTIAQAERAAERRSQMLGEIRSQHLITPAMDMSAYSGDEAAFLRRAYVQQVQEGGIWATRPDDQGVVLFDPSGFPVIDAQTGEQVFIAWDDVPLNLEERNARAMEEVRAQMEAIAP